MFSENQKISGRQLQRLVVLDWAGKASLLLPLFIEHSDGRSFVLSLLMGLAGAFGYICLIAWVGKQIRNDFYGYIQNRMGRGAAIVICLIYWFYALVNTVYLVRLFGEIAGTFLLPELPQEVCLAMLTAAGCYGAWGGLESRARTAEVLYRILLIPLGILLFLAALHVQPEYLSPGQARVSMQSLRHGMQIFIAFGGAGIFLFVTPRLNAREKIGRSLKKSILLVGAGVLAIFLTSIGTFGEGGMQALPWPVITLMSTVEVPGGFLQRWDVIFTGLLLSTFFVASTTGMYYIRLMTEQLLPWGKRRGYLVAAAVLVFLAACGCESYEAAARIYVILNGYVMVPLSVGFTCILALIEWNKRGKMR